MFDGGQARLALETTLAEKIILGDCPRRGSAMTFGVFVHRADSIYEDSPSEHYQFPGQYLSRARKCEGEWIVYYEPTKVPGTRGYYAVAQVAEVVPDPRNPNMYRALIEPGSYLDFTAPVPFTDVDGLAERGLLNADGRISGRAQAAVREISAADFHRIVSRGLAGTELLLPRQETIDKIDPSIVGISEQDQVPFEYEVERERFSTIVTRALRDRVFRKTVLGAYDERCAISGLKLINGGGRAEVEAAHIRPVERGGPDSINNGMALSGTAHWMFDRGLIGIDDELEIQISRQVNDIEAARKLVNSTGRLIGPLHLRDRPHPAFLRWHRENCFKH